MFAARGGFLAEPVITPPVPGWDVTTAVYNTDSFSVSSQDATPQGLTFKPDGTKMYICGNASDSVHEYNLSSAWDITTASYVQSFSVSAQDSNPTDVAFKTDGTKMYVCGATNDDISEYNLSSAWNISTASYLQGFDVSAQESIVLGLYFRNDGTKFYITGNGSDSVNEYDLSSAWNVTTASHVQTYSVSSQDDNPGDVYFKPNGGVMYVVGETSDRVFQYELSSAWNISTSVIDGSADVSSQTTDPRDVAFNDDGTLMFVLGGTTIYAYDL